MTLLVIVFILIEWYDTIGDCVYTDRVIWHYWWLCFSWFILIEWYDTIGDCILPGLYWYCDMTLLVIVFILIEWYDTIGDCVYTDRVTWHYWWVCFSWLSATAAEEPDRVGSPGQTENTPRLDWPGGTVCQHADKVSRETSHLFIQSK